MATLWARGDWLLNQNNTPAHVSNLLQQYLVKHYIVQFRQPPFTPHISFCDCWLFPRLKMPLKVRQFDDVQATETNAKNS